MRSSNSDQPPVKFTIKTTRSRFQPAGGCFVRPGLAEHGFTLIEVLVAAVLIGGGLMAYIMMTGNIISRNQDNKREGVAITLAQDKIEDIKEIALATYLSDASGLSSPTFDYSTYSWSASTTEIIDYERGVGTANAYYTRSWTITQVDSLGQEKFLSDVAVTVSWGEFGVDLVKEDSTTKF